MFGRMASLSALVAQVNRETVIVETGERRPTSAPDQVVLAGTLPNGTVISATVQGSAAPGAAIFEARIVGRDATLLIRPGGPGSFQMADWQIQLMRHDGMVENLPAAQDDPLPPGIPSGPPRHVANLYREIGRAIVEGRDAHPNFDDAVRLHELLDTIRLASASGTRQALN
jgi:predicted dehydrogenase